MKLLKEVKTHIEKRYDIELSEMQLRVLESIIRGEKIYVPRGFGRSTLYNGYIDYLKEESKFKHYKDKSEFDLVITADMLKNDEYWNKSGMKKCSDKIKEDFPDAYDFEFNCKSK